MSACVHMCRFFCVFLWCCFIYVDMHTVQKLMQQLNMGDISIELIFHNMHLEREFAHRLKRRKFCFFKATQDQT